MWRRRSNVACICSNSLRRPPNFKKGCAVQNLGETRSSQQPNHLLLTPDTFVRAPLPGMKACAAVVHAGPAIGARFTQYTAEFESGGELGRNAQRSASSSCSKANSSWRRRPRKRTRNRAATHIFPKASPHRVVATKASRAAVIEKPYQPLASVERRAQLFPAKMLFPHIRSATIRTCK